MEKGKQTHAAEFYVEVEPEFTYSGSVKRLKATKTTQNKPEMRQGAAYVKVSLVFEDETWSQVVPEAVINVPLEATGTVEVVSEPLPALSRETATSTREGAGYAE